MHGGGKQREIGEGGVFQDANEIARYHRRRKPAAGVTESAADSPRRDWSRITEQLLTRASAILDTDGPLAPVMVLSLSRIIASGIALERMIHDIGPTAGGVAPWHLWAQELRSINRDRMLAQDRLDWPEDDDEETEH